MYCRMESKVDSLLLCDLPFGLRGLIRELRAVVAILQLRREKRKPPTPVCKRYSRAQKRLWRCIPDS